MITHRIKHLITIVAAAAITLASVAGGAYAALKDNNNGTITDTATGLVWLKNANCFGWQRWQDAMNCAAGLQSGSCGLSDKSTAGQWRLPTKEELAVRASNKAGFTNALPNGYWSSNTYVPTPSLAWFVDMTYGYVQYNGKGNLFYVWPVRAGQ